MLTKVTTPYGDQYVRPETVAWVSAPFSGLRNVYFPGVTTALLSVFDSPENRQALGIPDTPQAPV